MALVGTGAKFAGKMMAGQQLGKYFDILSGTAGQLANQAAQAGV